MTDRPMDRQVLSHAANVVPLAIVFGVLAIRTLVGLDLTDEMQYYGQILGLVETNRLFSYDLFIQQVVYVVFFPLFKLHQWAFGQTGLVLFGRLMLCGMLLALFVYARRELRLLGASPWQAGLSAAGLTFCVPWMGIFALSYNTLSQMAWVIFMIWWWPFESRMRPLWLWALLIVAAGLAHPISGVMLTAMLMLRWAVTGGWKRALTQLIWVLVWSLPAMFAILMFTSPRELIDSLLFSSNFGVGSTSLALDHHRAFCGLLMLALFLRSWLPTSPSGAMLGRKILLAAIAVAATFLLHHAWQGESVLGIYFPELVDIAVVLMCAALWQLCAQGDRASAIRTRWLVAAALVHFVTLTWTSSNGFSQGLGAAWLALPLAIGLWRQQPQALASLSASTALRAQTRPHATNVLFAALCLALLSVHWTTFAYRDRPWYAVHHVVNDIPAFKYVRINAEFAQMIQDYREALLEQVSDRPVLIASNLAGLYLALNAKPATCMLYMHALPTDRARPIFDRCVEQKRPEAILHVVRRVSDYESTLPQTGRYISELAARWNFTQCREGRFPMPAAPALSTTRDLAYYRYCQLPG